MIILQPGYPLRNGSASTSDWIGQVVGGIIYAYDLDTLFSENKAGIAFATPDNQDLVNKAVQKYKTRFKESWEELSDK